MGGGDVGELVDFVRSARHDALANRSKKPDALGVAHHDRLSDIGARKKSPGLVAQVSRPTHTSQSNTASRSNSKSSSEAKHCDRSIRASLTSVDVIRLSKNDSLQHLPPHVIFQSGAGYALAGHVDPEDDAALRVADQAMQTDADRG
jgi:hypothetical protein